MKRFSFWLRIFIIIEIVIINIIPVIITSAASSIDIVVTARPKWSGGISGFTITYINEHEIDFNWIVGANVSKVMIRGSYNNYPVNPPDINTAPSDGYLVYYGNGTSANDTSVNFEQNPGPVYYSAWAQLNDGTWNLVPFQGDKESGILTLIFIGLIVGIAMLVYAQVRSTPVRMVCAFTWLIPVGYIKMVPPSTIPEGSPQFIIAFVVMIGIGLVLAFMSFSRNTRVTDSSSFNGGMRNISREHQQWKLPEWLNGLKGESYSEMRSRRIADLTEYRNRVHNSLWPDNYDGRGRRRR